MVQRQGSDDGEEGLGAVFLWVLEQRYGQSTIVRLADGKELTVYDGTGWGMDAGDVWEHVIARTTPLSEPPREGDHYFFYLSEVECLLDPESGEVLISQVPRPGET